MVIDWVRKQIDNFFLFRRFPVLKQFIKFGLVGCSNLVIDMVIYWLLTRCGHLFYILAAFLSFMVAVTWSFFMNRRWTFRYQEKGMSKQYVKFVIANAVSMALNLTLLYLLVEIVDFYDLLAKVVVAVGVGVFNFSFNKFWTFRIYKSTN